MLQIFHRLVLTLMIVLAIPAAADTACPPEPAVPTPDMLQSALQSARDRGFLWRISKDGHASYLYGTMHVANVGLMFPGPTVTQAMLAADTVALELDAADPEIQQRIEERVAELRGPALPPSLAQRVDAQAKRLCASPEAFDKLIPELKLVGLAVLAARDEGLDSAYAIDLVIAGFGRKARKDVVSLETPELQLTALQMHTPEETFAFVTESLEDLETGRARVGIKRLALAWGNADYVEMERFGDWCECLRTPLQREVMKRILDDRNPGLADSIDAMHHAGKRVFAAVGSLHLFGPSGLPALMAQRGYRVERVDFRAGDTPLR